MYAVVRGLTFDPAKVAEAERQFAEFQIIHPSQPGYASAIVIDMSEGWQLTLTVNL